MKLFLVFLLAIVCQLSFAASPGSKTLLGSDVTVSSASGATTYGPAITTDAFSRIIFKIDFGVPVASTPVIHLQGSFNRSTWYEITDSGASTTVSASGTYTYEDADFSYPNVRVVINSPTAPLNVIRAFFTGKGF